ncbi:Mg/Co/Ni transporter MgtE [Methyloglobulus morosus KoM1]|uniref:Mg/Co/Ni transporter MgtE n=1 Tax=Methyloglobulus morosus KoM1 TaxID=1116472 RepID=V5BJZ7_9GAMM|nr:CBS domain-containing protein [Methyloglobulus morosus]ESS66467.1 Mg/Co/Ni transporter MgtE [Methyloglobulus morosus KoM1]
MKKVNNMAEIIKKIGKTLQEQAIPAAQRLLAIVSNVMAILCVKAEEITREISQAPEPAMGVKATADWAGSHMHCQVPTAQTGETVSKVIRRLAKLPNALDTIELLFVTDADQRLLGIVSLPKLLVAKPQMAIVELMNREFTSAGLADYPERVAQLALTHHLPAVPIVNDQGRLLGAVPAYTVFKIMREEHIQDHYCPKISSNKFNWLGICSSSALNSIFVTN